MYAQGWRVLPYERSLRVVYGCHRRDLTEAARGGVSCFLLARRKSCRKRAKGKQLSLTAYRLDTGANWRVLALSQAHHRSRVSDSVN